MNQNYFRLVRLPTRELGRKLFNFPRVFCTGHKPSVGLGHIRIAYEAAVTAALASWRRLFFGLIPVQRGRMVAVMGFIDNALSPITLRPSSFSDALLGAR